MNAPLYDQKISGFDCLLDTTVHESCDEPTPLGDIGRQAKRANPCPSCGNPDPGGLTCDVCGMELIEMPPEDWEEDAVEQKPTPEQFLTSLAGPFRTWNDRYLWLNQFGCPPEQATPKDWAGYPINAKGVLPDSRMNGYFSVGIFKAKRRVQENQIAAFVLVLDDIDTDALSDLPLHPTYIVETSPGNHHVGFGIADQENVAQYRTLLERMTKAGIIKAKADGAGNNTNRYVRLPGHINNKADVIAEHGEPFVTRLVEFAPERRYTIAKLADVFCVSLERAHRESSTTNETRTGDAEYARQIMTGEGYHDGIVRLSARWAQHGNMDEGEAVGLLRGMMEANPDRSERWKNRYDDIPRTVRSAWEKYRQKLPEVIRTPRENAQQVTPYPPPFRGAMAAIHGQIMLTSPKPQPKLTTLATLVGMAGSIPGIYRLDDISRCNLYGLIVAESGDGKDNPQFGARDIVIAAGGKLIGQPASGEGLEDALESRRGMLSVLDEVAHIVAALNSSKAPAHMLSLARNLLTLYSAGKGRYTVRQRAKDKKGGGPEEPEVIAYPCFSLLAASTPGKLGAAATTANIEDGLLGRMLFAFGADNPKHTRVRRRFEMSPEVEQVAEQIKHARFLTANDDSGNLEPYINPEIVIGVTNSADRALEHVITLFSEQTGQAGDNPLQRTLCVRSYEKVSRIAGVLAVWDNPRSPGITDEHVAWALHLVQASNSDALRFLTEHMHGGEVQANAQEILRTLKRLTKQVPDGRVWHSDLLRGVSKKMDAQQFGIATAHLIELEEIERDEVKFPSGRKSHVYRLG